MKIIKLDTIDYADSFYKRLKGYMFQKLPTNREVKIFDKCNSVHTFNMKFDLDILFLNETNKVIKIARSVPKGRFLPPVRGASKVVEGPVGIFSKIEVDEVIAFDAINSKKKVNG